MAATLFVLLLLLAASAAVLLWRLKELQRLVDALSDDQRQLASAWNALPPDAGALIETRRALLSIEILNPAELAAQESAFAGIASNLAPRLVRKLVYQRTAAMLREELVKYGVRAEVKLHGLA